MNVTCNVSKKRKVMQKSDVLILSIGKSGRTWLRVMINKYISLAYDIPFSLEDLSGKKNEVPSIFYTHEKWAHYGNATLSQKIRGRYIVPEKILSTKKVVLLVRDPKDVIVSLYFHAIKRDRKATDRGQNVEIKLMDFVEGPKSRMPFIVKVLNDWRKRLAKHPDCLWLSYEDLMADTRGKFFQVLQHIGFETVNQDFAMQAIEFGKFENMKKMEAEDQFNSKILRPGDPSDPDSYKVRKGEVGGYVDYFTDDEITLLHDSIAGLDPYYGYTESS